MGKRSGAKKKKNRYLLKPPLTVLDIVIYSIGLILSAVLLFGLIINAELLSHRIAFSDPGAVAYFSGAGTLLALPFFLVMILVTFAPIIHALSEKRPIFGNPKIRYGEPPFHKDCIPLIRGKYKKHFTADRPSHKKFRRFLAIICVITLFISMIPLPFSLYNRTALYSDGSIKKFNIINQVTKSYTADDFEGITVSAKYVAYGGQYATKYRWESMIDIETADGKSITFSIDEFNLSIPEGKDIYLETMLHLKSLFPSDKITITGRSDVGKVADEWNMTDEQIKKLEEIFS